MAIKSQTVRCEDLGEGAFRIKPSPGAPAVFPRMICTDVTRPAKPNWPTGTPCWNTDDNAYNYWDMENLVWRDALGVLT